MIQNKNISQLVKDSLSKIAESPQYIFFTLNQSKINDQDLTKIIQSIFEVLSEQKGESVFRLDMGTFQWNKNPTLSPIQDVQFQPNPHGITQLLLPRRQQNQRCGVQMPIDEPVEFLIRVGPEQIYNKKEFNKIGDKECKYLAKGQWPLLKYIDLCRNITKIRGQLYWESRDQIYHQGKLNNMQYPYLTNNKISEKGCISLIMISWQFLQILSFYKNQIQQWENQYFPIRPGTLGATTENDLIIPVIYLDASLIMSETIFGLLLWIQLKQQVQIISMRMRKQKHSAMNKSLNQEDQFSDTQRQMIMGSLKKAIPTIHCPSSVQACQLCINPHCHNVSLKCSSSKCIACYEPQQHQSCIKITLHKFTELVNKKTYPWRQELISIFKLQEKLMTIIRATFMQFTEKFMASKMKEHEIESIIDIFENRNYYALRGSQSSDLCNHLQKKQTQDEKNKSVNKLKQYEKMLESQMENIKNIRSKFFISEVTLQIPLNTKQTKKPEENIVKEQKLNSLIPTNKEKYNFESLSLLSNHKGFQKLKQYKEYDFGKVKFIDLFGCQIKNKGCQELRNTPFTQLQQLHLAENSIDDAGCKLLSQGNWNNLNTLNLRSNSIGYQGCRALCQAKWNNLKYLDLRQNKIEKTHQKQLQKQLKRRWAEIQILWQWPL